MCKVHVGPLTAPTTGGVSGGEPSKPTSRQVAELTPHFNPSFLPAGSCWSVAARVEALPQPFSAAPDVLAYQEEDAHSGQRAQDDPFEWVRDVHLRQCHQHGMMEIPVPLRACHLIEVAREALEFLVQLLPDYRMAVPDRRLSNTCHSENIKDCVDIY